MTKIDGAFHLGVTEETGVSERLDDTAISIAVVVECPVSDELQRNVERVVCSYSRTGESDVRQIPINAAELDFALKVVVNDVALCVV